MFALGTENLQFKPMLVLRKKGTILTLLESLRKNILIIIESKFLHH